MPFRSYATKKRRPSRSASRRPAKKRVTSRRRASSKPSRLRVSSTRTYVDRAIVKALSNVSETKYSAFTEYCITPAAKPAGTQPMTYVFRNAGGTLTQSANSMFAPMDLYNFPKGDGSTERNGDYMFIKKSHMKLEVQMLPTTGDTLNSTTEFRLMIVKANRKYNKLGSSPTPANSLFLTSINDEFGFGVPGGTSTADVFANMQQPIDKRKWLVYRDMRFTLSTPAQETTDPGQVGFNSANNKYSVKKFITADLPIFKKCHFPSDSDVPDNVDTQFLLIIQAVRSNYCQPDVESPRNWACNVMATTSATDN